MKWSRAAEEAVSRVPFFVRKKVKKRVEEEATRCGSKEVELKHVNICQSRFLNRMEEEVKGHRVETCFGASGCPNRAVIAEGLPERLEALLAGKNLKYFLKEKVKGPLRMHHEFRVSISDCPNACSRPQIVDVGLIAACMPEVGEEACTGCVACIAVCKEKAVTMQEGRPLVDPSKCLFCAQCVRECPTGTLQRGQVGFRVLIGGKLGRHPRLGRELPGVHSQGETFKIVENCVDFFQRHCVSGERLGEILEHTGREPREMLVSGDTCGSCSS